MLNFSFLFGDELRLRALHTGATAAMAANPIWALTVTGGFVSNLVYCVYLLYRNKTWMFYREPNWPIYWLLGVSTAVSWGAVSGEWTGASRRALAYCWAGIGVLVMSIGVIAAANMM